MTESAKLRELERRLWQAADQLRANSKLRAADYSIPVLGLIFLRYADVRFGRAEERLEATATARNPVTRSHYQAEGVMHVPKDARFGYLRTLPESADLGRAVNDAMTAIEEHNPDLRGVLPRDYGGLDWKKRQQTRAAVEVAINGELDAGLPEAYGRRIYSDKCARVFQHIFESYHGAGKSIYAEVA